MGEYYDKHWAKYGYMLAGTVFQKKESTEKEKDKENRLIAIFGSRGAGAEIPFIIGDWYITVGYGSVLFDGEVFRFKQPIDQVFDGFAICDSCIEELKVGGVIEQIYDFFENTESK